MNMNLNTWTEEKLAKCIGRMNPYAIQLKNGGYIPVYKDAGKEALLKHLRGEHTMGSYVIRKDNKVSYGVIDIDGDT